MRQKSMIENAPAEQVVREEEVRRPHRDSSNFRRLTLLFPWGIRNRMDCHRPPNSLRARSAPGCIGKTPRSRHTTLGSNAFSEVTASRTTASYDIIPTCAEADSREGFPN